MGPSETKKALAPGRETIPIGDKYYACAAARRRLIRHGFAVPPVSLRVGRSAGLTRHRRVIQHREPCEGKANGGVSFNTATHRGEGVGVRRQEQKTPTVAEASGRVSLRAGERRHSPFIRQRRQKALPARIRGKSQLSIAREGFLDRRSKRCFWLLLSPQTKVARAGARNYPQRRQIMRLRRCAATPHPPPSGAPVSLRVGRSAGLTRHRRIIQHRGPLKGKA